MKPFPSWIPDSNWTVVVSIHGGLIMAGHCSRTLRDHSMGHVLVFLFVAQALTAGKWQNQDPDSVVWLQSHFMTQRLRPVTHVPDRSKSFSLCPIISYIYLSQSTWSKSSLYVPLVDHHLQQSRAVCHLRIPRLRLSGKQPDLGTYLLEHFKTHAKRPTDSGACTKCLARL